MNAPTTPHSQGSQVDDLLANCAKEDIIHIGQIQPSCYYLEADPETFLVRACSSNIESLKGRTARSCLGASVDDLLGSEFRTKFLSLGNEQDTFLTYPASLPLGGKNFHVAISQRKTSLSIEIEPLGTSVLSDHDRQKIIHRPLRMAAASSVSEVIEEYASRFLEVAPFDRVLVYQFMDDWSGKVVCEKGSRANTDASMINLHFPASDIPPQARKLYELSPSRVIFDTEAPPADIVTLGNAKDFDLGLVRSRASSQVHLLYLANMGVRSSFSCSIMFKNQLWGLIACHHYTPLYLDLKARLDCERVTRGLAIELMRIHAERKMQMIENFKYGANSLIDLLPPSVAKPQDFSKAAQGLLELMDADGLAILKDEEMLRLGETPEPDEIRILAEIVAAKSDSRFFKVDNLASVYPRATAYANKVAGLLAVSTTALSKQTHDDVVFYWFRREYHSTVKWAGKPEKLDSIFRLKDGTPVLSPRSSFEAWAEERKHSCRPWTSEQIFKANLWVHNYARRANLTRAGALDDIDEALPFR